MAFRATSRPQPARQVSIPIAAEESQAITRPPQRKRSLADSQEEWVLFSPTAHSVTQTETTSTDRTARTAGLSRFSDFGSLDTGAGRSDQIGAAVEEINDNLTEHASDQDEDLDSLDDGLHAFHEPSDLGSPRARLARHTETVLPTHDGLGTFGDSSAIQDHLRQFEKHAGRRKLKRRSSVHRTLSALKEVEERNGEEDRVERIEHWRLEQSRALLEEIERETRRMRRLSRATAARSRASSINMQTKSDINFSASGYATPTAVPTEGTTQISTIPEDGSPQNESFWKRFTRRVIRDLIGIDESLLSVIFGETLVEESQQDLSSSTSSLPDPEVQAEIQRMAAESDESFLGSSSWQERLLERLAKELGILVHQLSEHPGAFSTYMRTQEPPSYAGLPNTATLPDPFASEAAVSPASILFSPSVQQQVATDADPSLWGIEEETEPVNFALSALSEAARLAQEREYWEKDLDVNMVFKFLKSRFSSGAASVKREADAYNNSSDIFGAPLNRPISQTSELHNSTSSQFNARRTSNTSAFTAHRAAIIRQHHPLASSSTRRRERQTTPLHHAGIVRRTARTATSSCASQSTKKSKLTGSSRNYWDLGGSVSSGPNGVGAWGDVSV
jgi:hypothetical protein